MKRIAIQGELGSFHDITAHQYFEGEQIEIICCATFEEVFENIKRDPTVVGICAIENTIAGSLLHNYELLRQSGTTVVGEHKLHIEHSICCLPEDDWSTLQEVHSHPVALMQCGKFLANHPDLKAVVNTTIGGAWSERTKSIPLTSGILMSTNKASICSFSIISRASIALWHCATSSRKGTFAVYAASCCRASGSSSIMSVLIIFGSVFII